MGSRPGVLLATLMTAVGIASERQGIGSGITDLTISIGVESAVGSLSLEVSRRIPEPIPDESESMRTWQASAERVLDEWSGDSISGCRHGRHAAFQLFMPVQDDAQLRGGLGDVAWPDHDEPLAIRRHVIRETGDVHVGTHAGSQLPPVVVSRVAALRSKS